jgi:hypothetical protein
MNNLIRPPFPGRFPPACSCGCDPCRCDEGFPPEWAKFGFRLRECFREIDDFRRLIADIIKEMGPAGGTIGVIDGSDAKQGQVGEYVTGQAVFAYAAYPATTTGTVQPLVLQPGDWNITASLTPSTDIGSVFFGLSPVPAGMSNNLSGSLAIGSSTGQQETGGTVIGTAARGSFSVPTLMPFTVTVEQGTQTNLPAGSATLRVEARRMR